MADLRQPSRPGQPPNADAVPRRIAGLELAFWPVCLLVAVALVLVVTVVDLAPRVSPDFFFATGDPALEATQAIGETFAASDQLYLAARVAEPLAAETLDKVRALSDALEAVPGVAGVLSLTHVPALPATIPTSPLWGRLLLAPDDPRLTNLIVDLEPAGEAPRRATLEAVETVVRAHDLPSFDVVMSGVPYVVELVRRALIRDLRRFSLASALVFGLLVAAIYRSWPIVAGTLVTGAAAALLTLAGNYLLGTTIGVLTANIVTIVFVLSISHIVFLTANAQRLGGELGASAGGRAVVSAAVARTLPASFWSAATTLFGFLSLRLASAQPLRELAIAGATATVAAMVAAYTLYPRFLARARLRRGAAAGRGSASGRPIRWWPAIALAALAAVASLGLGRLDTDPSLLAFFDPDGEIHRGIERIDRTGGSSPLVLVVRDPADAPDAPSLLDEPSDVRLRSLQTALDADPDTGVVLSLPLLVDEARRVPLVRFVPRPQLVDLLASEQFDGIANSFVDPARQRALFFLRMRETDRRSPRSAVIERTRSAIQQAGLAVDAIGGIYHLQAALGALVISSLVRGLAGLLALFVVVAAVVARAPRPAAAMVGALVLVPLLLLGTMGLLGWPVDFISSPASNIALALGIDGMIHLVAAYRRERRAGSGTALAWQRARAALGPAIVSAMAILAGGFGIFALSSFPPTARFGLAVAVGTLAAAAAALAVLPPLAGGADRG